MLDTIRKPALTIAALVALGLGGAAIAGAAEQNRSTTVRLRARLRRSSPQGQGRPQREALSSEDAAKVKAAALAKVPGATVLRTEAGGPYGTPYHAHIQTSDGTRKVVLVDADFQATAVQADQGRGGGRNDGRGHGGRGSGETALTGETKQKVEAAVLAKYAGATIVRTETNDGDADAPYESHIRTTAGQELEVLVSKDFEVVGANERPARP